MIASVPDVCSSYHQTNQLPGGDVLPVSRKPRYEEDGTIPKGVRVKCTYRPARLQALYQRALVNCQPPLFGSGSIRSPTDPPAIRLYGSGNEDEDKQRSGKILGILSSEPCSNIENRAANGAIEKGLIYRNDPHGRDDERNFDTGELKCYLK